jgi:hypothetical protein
MPPLQIVFRVLPIWATQCILSNLQREQLAVVPMRPSCKGCGGRSKEEEDMEEDRMVVGTLGWVSEKFQSIANVVRSQGS